MTESPNNSMKTNRRRNLALAAGQRFEGRVYGLSLHSAAVAYFRRSSRPSHEQVAQMLVGCALGFRGHWGTGGLAARQIMTKVLALVSQ
jgi:hypothetical protein